MTLYTSGAVGDDCHGEGATNNQTPHASGGAPTHSPSPSPLQGIAAAAQELAGLDGVTTFCEMAVPLAARLAEKLGLPGNLPAAVDAARDKVRGRVLAPEPFVKQ